MHRSHHAECQQQADGGADVGDDNMLDKCDGVSKRWSPWYNSDVPKQVRGF